MENLVVDMNAMFEELVEQGRANGVYDREGYRDLCVEILNEHERVGEIHDDSNIQGRIEALVSRFDEYLARTQ